MKLMTIILAIFLSTTLMFCSISCSTVKPISTDDWREHFEPGHTKEKILKKFNLYSGDWWNYYARGRWLAHGNFNSEAIYDFKTALKLRTSDQRGARSYGMHSWDYFAQRELGVAYYNTGKYDDSILELEASLRAVESAKAKFYLNKARQAVLSQSGIDRKPPVIEITSFNDGDFVNIPTINVKGNVNDDYYANEIWVDNNKLFVELASNKLAFDEEIYLTSGENTISIKAVDLVGNQASSSIKLTLDMLPPVILVDQIPNFIPLEKKTLLKGSIVDNYGIERFWINDKEIDIEKGKKISFDESVDIPLDRSITFKATDVAGNTARGKYTLNIKSSRVQLESEGLPGIVSQKDSFIDATSKKKDTIAPEIETDLKSVTVYNSQYFINVKVWDKAGIDSLFVNDTRFSCNSAEHVFFSHILLLEEGENGVKITAVDVNGNRNSLPPVTIIKETYKVFRDRFKIHRRVNAVRTLRKYRFGSGSYLFDAFTKLY